MEVGRGRGASWDCDAKHELILIEKSPELPPSSSIVGHADLTEARVSFALIGGLAVSARTEPRFTRDADLAVALANDAEAKALIHSLRARDYLIEAVVEPHHYGRVPLAQIFSTGW